MNDRSLRHIIVGLLDQGINGVMREDGFEITAASEIMAILCLADSLRDLKKRIGDVIVGYDSLRRPIPAREVGADGAMTALLKNAINPNLVQTIEGTPAFVHGGPFANIAHGCNSLIATRMAMKLADFVVTEAGFGADLGAEKFFHIKCRAGNLNPAAAVLVVPKQAYDRPRPGEFAEACGEHSQIQRASHRGHQSVCRGPARRSCKGCGKQCLDAGVEAVVTDFREQGGEGGLELAETARRRVCPVHAPTGIWLPAGNGTGRQGPHRRPANLRRSSEVRFTPAASTELHRIENLGYGELPVCMAKTPLVADRQPEDLRLPAEISRSPSAGRRSRPAAGFVVIYTGKIMTMPGLPKEPAALQIDIDDDGVISGYF